MKLTKALIVLSITLTSFAVTSCQDGNQQNEGENQEMQNTGEAQSFEQRQDQQTNPVRTTVKGNPELSTFSLRMDATNVADSIEQAQGAVTVFAPNNAAYSYLFREHGENALENINREDEINFLFAEGELTLDSLRSGIQENNGTFTVPSLQGEHLLISMRNDSIFVRGRAGSGAAIIEPDMDATNGVVHIINTVILPGDIQTNVELQSGQNQQNQNQQNQQNQ